MLNFMQIRGKNPEQQPNSVSQANQAKVVTDKKKKKTLKSAGVLLYLYTYSNTINSNKYCRLYSCIKYRHLGKQFAFS